MDSQVSFFQLDSRVFLADMAHQAILSRENLDEEGMEESITNELAKEFEGEPFLGPNNIVFSQSGGKFHPHKRKALFHR